MEFFALIGVLVVVAAISSVLFAGWLVLVMRSVRRRQAP